MNATSERNTLESRVVEQFGDQWNRFTENEGYYGSLPLFEDIVCGTLDIAKFKGAKVAEIGSGSGRIVLMLNEAQVASIVAVEPSDAMIPLKKNTQPIASKITYLKKMGDEWEAPDLDYIFSIGVLHHIVDPDPTVRNAFKNLKPGGEFVVWLYGYEGNELYLALAEPLRAFTTKVPHVLMNPITWFLLPFLIIYANLCRVLPLPMRDYMTRHILKLTPAVQRLTIYDQLKPSWAKYYRRGEAEDLLRRNGFVDIVSVARHGYSWTVKGRKPDR